MARRPRLVLFDSHALIHRAYHALPPMTTKEGAPTQAVYGFATTFLKVLATLKPTHALAAFDRPGKTFRHETFADYKAHRPEAPEDLIPQFELTRQFLQAFNVPILDAEGFEADDVLGTIVTQLAGQVEMVVVTGDMDALQLVSDHTTVFTLRRGVTDTVIYDVDLVREKYGFGPELVVDYKGLRGDPSDNIPGVAGVGDKTARDLIQQYGSIEAIYDHLDELPTRIQNRLRDHKEEALLSRRLATIARDVPISFTLESAVLADYDTQAVREFFERMEFRSLLKRLPKSSRAESQGTLFGTSADALGRALPDHYRLADTPETQAELRAAVQAASVIAIDTETDRLGARTAPIVGMSIAFPVADEVQAWYVPVTRESVQDWRDLLESPAIGKVGHNIKYDVEVFRQSDIVLGPISFDTMIASYLLQPGSRQHSLDAVAAQELGRHMQPITELIGTGRQQLPMSKVPLEQITYYACEDAEVTWRLYEKLRGAIVEEKLDAVLRELELPLITVLVDMELAGVRLDVAALQQLEKKFSHRLTEVRQAIWQAAGEEFNVNSTQQLRSILYEKLQLSTHGIARTQSGYSTAASELGKLRDAHVIIPLLEEYRELSKLLTTYVTTLPQLVDAQTKRVHASFNQTVAATGRLSSQDPNLQNIPVRTELGQEIRAAFIAERGKRLVKADYSQLELRIAAHLAQDEKMIEAFRAGKDIHRITAAWVHGIAETAVTDAQRREAKALNFGVLYGMGPQRFAREAGLSVEEGRSFIERYHAQFAGVTQLTRETVVQAETQGFVETLFGRRRYIPEIQSRSPQVRAQAERAAFNFPMQGTESDILKKAMIALWKTVQQRYPEARLVLTVHDELVCEVPTNYVEEFAKVMRTTMESVVQLDVPLEVEVAVGKNWRDMEPVA